MTTCAIGIVGHIDRADAAHQLMADTDAAYLSLDNGTYGCHGNHRRVWRHLSERFGPHVDWLVVLEDDAIPCADFTEQLHQALSVSLNPIVSLYLGRLRPTHLQYMVEPALQRAADNDASLLISRHMLHAVGVAIQSARVPELLAEVTENLPIDEAIGAWAIQRHFRIAYTHPSLVDHTDGDTLLKHPDNQKREPGRVAWRFGTRRSWNYEIVEMN